MLLSRIYPNEGNLHWARPGPNGASASADTSAGSRGVRVFGQRLDSGRVPLRAVAGPTALVRVLACRPSSPRERVPAGAGQ